MASRISLDSYDRLRGVVVRATFSDSLGFLWLATDNGLWRWEGTGRTDLPGGFVQRSDLLPPGTSVGKPTMSVTCLVENSDQILWVGTKVGLFAINVETLKIVTPKPLAPNEWVVVLHKDRHDRIWVGGYGGVKILSFDGTTHSLEPIAELEEFDVFAMTAGEGDDIWIGAAGAVLRVQGSNITRSFDRFLTTHHVRALSYDSNGALWIGTRLPGSLFRFQDGVMTEFGEADGLASVEINALTMNPDGDLWVGTERGLACWNADWHSQFAGRFTMLDHNDGLNNTDIHSLFVDDEQQLWIGSLGGGVFRLRSAHIRTFGMDDGLEHPTITSLGRLPDGQILAGSPAGPFRFDPRSYEAGKPAMPSSKLALPVRSTGISLPIKGIFVQRSGEIWLTGNFGTRRLSDETILGLPMRPCLGEDAEGRFLQGYHGGLARWENGEFVYLPNAPTSLGALNALALLADGALLVAAEGGLAEFRDNRWIGIFEGRDIRAIHIESNGRVLLGSSTGLGQLKDGSFIPFETQMGRSYAVRGMVEDHDGVVWVATDHGLLKIVEDQVERFTYEDGLPDQDLRCVALGADGVLFAGTSQGLVRIETERLRPCSTAPRLVFSSLIAGGQEVELGLAHATIPYARRTLLIRTQRLGWRSTVGAKTRFRLAERDEFWSQPAESGVFSHVGMPPGTYTLLAQAVNERGIESEIASLSFTIHSPFWWSWWFISSVVFAVVGGTWMMQRQYRYCLVLLRVAQAANEAKSEFVSRMSHEIRTPLSVILGCAERLTDQSLTGTYAKNMLDTILRNGKHLSTVVNSVLDFSKVQQGRASVERIPCDLAELLADLRQIAEHKTQGRPVAVVTQMEPDVPPWIMTDLSHIRQILINLVDNAVKFTESGSVGIHVATIVNDRGPFVRFDVEDTGIGIPEQHRDTIFEAFEQADASISRQYGGTGLGLAIARAFATQLGGTLELSSGVGVGSTFTLEIPLHPCTKPDHETADHTQSAMVSERPLADMRILLADDSEDIRTIVRLVLELAGASVVSVACGTEVLKVAEQTRFDAILLDVHMPGVDGLETAQELLRRGGAPPLLAMSADSTEETRERCLKVGFRGFLAKPFAESALVDELRAFVRVPENVETSKRRNVETSKPSNLQPSNFLTSGPIWSRSAARSERFATAAADYVKSLAIDLERLDSTLSAGDFSELGEIAHRLIGSGGINGFDCVTDVATKMRSAAMKKDTDSLSDHITHLRSLHGRMEQAIQQAGYARRSGESAG